MSTTETTTAATRRRSVLALAFGIPISAGFLVVAIRGTDLQAAWRTVRGANLSWLALAIVGLCVFMVGGGARWSVLLRRVRHTSVPVGTAVVVVAVALSNSIPGRPGDVARVWWAARTSTKPTGHAASTVVLDRVADVIILTAALAVAAASSPPRRGLTAILVGAMLLTLTFLGLIAAAVFYCHSARGKTRAVAEIERSPMRTIVSTFLRGLADLSVSQAVLTICLTLVAWIGFGFTAWATGRALRIDLSVLTIVMLTAVVNLGIAIPSSPGFVGTYQWLVVATLEPYGFSRATAFAYSLVLHAVTLIPPTIAGYAILGIAVRTGRLNGLTLRPRTDRSPEKNRPDHATGRCDEVNRDRRTRTG